MKLTFCERLFSYMPVSTTHCQLCVLGVRIKLRRSLKEALVGSCEPINPRKIVLHSVFGAYQCNPKYIAEELLRRGVNCELVWVVEKNILHFLESYPKNIRLVMRGTSEAMRELATARIWVENDTKGKEMAHGLYKRPGQVYINTWHGSLGIKKTGNQRSYVSKLSKVRTGRLSDQVDLFISNSTYMTSFYREAFGGHAEIRELGYPRNDVFFQPEEERRKLRCKVCAALGIDPAHKILLWAPTFRENGETCAYSLDAAATRNAFTQRFGGTWVPVVRLHSVAVVGGERVGAGWKDASYYPDMQEMLVAADGLVTDYSSCIYDYLLTRRPGFIYAPDHREYAYRRGLCYPLSETPFPVAETNEQLEQAICSFDEAVYQGRVEAFLRGKGSMDDGHASARVADLIEDILEGKEGAA